MDMYSSYQGGSMHEMRKLRDETSSMQYHFKITAITTNSKNQFNCYKFGEKKLLYEMNYRLWTKTILVVYFGEYHLICQF